MHPIEENDDVNLFRFVRNAPLNLIDADGNAALPPPVVIVPIAIIVAGTVAVICYCSYLNRHPQKCPPGTTISPSNI